MPESVNPLGFLRDLQTLITVDPIDKSIRMDPGVTLHTTGMVVDTGWNLPSGKAATLTVAASDAAALTKALADYVCDGTADDVQIQAAIDALPAGGGNVHLTEGIFVTAAAINVSPNTALTGAGPGITIVKFRDTDVANGTKMFELNNADDVSIEGMTLDGNKANQSETNLDGIRAWNGTTGLRIFNVETKNFTQHGIQSVAVDASFYDQIYTHDNNGRGIRWEGGNNNTVGWVKAEANAKAGFNILRTGASTPATNFTIGTILAFDNLEEGVVIDTIHDFSIGAIVAENNGAGGGNPGDGVAFGGCDRGSIGTITASSNSSANQTGSGVKITQDTQSPQVACSNMAIGAIITYDNDENGLHINQGTDISIGSFVSNGDDLHDFYITPNGNSTRISINGITYDARSFDHDDALFDATATTDSVAIWTQPANSILMNVELEVVTTFAFSGGASALTVTIGDGGDPDGILVAGAMNLDTDASRTVYSGRGAHFDATVGMLLKESATAWTAYATSAVENLNTTTAGSINVLFGYKLF